MDGPSVDKFLRLADANKYVVHRSADDLNIVGWRNPEAAPNTYSCFISVYWSPKDGVWREETWAATTFPGTPYLAHPINKKGCAILVPGQYCYKMGKHKGSEALVQASPVSVYRDANTDFAFDLDRVTIEQGYFGINIHRPGLFSKIVGLSSAGCQVFKSREEFNSFIRLCYWRSEPDTEFKKFTYTLLEL